MAESHGFGWIPDRPDQRDHAYAAPPAVLAVLPLRVDLTSQCPPIYDQGNIGSCTANAIAAAVQFDQMKEKLTDIVTPSRLFIYYNERAMENTVDSDSGAMLRVGIKCVARFGDCSEDLWPYDTSRFKEKPPDRCYAEARKHPVVSYQRLSHNLSQMKGCLASGYPFVFGIALYESFVAGQVRETGDIPLPQAGESGPDGKPPAGHAMVAVGYDDVGQRFLVRNCFGEGWGQKGYGTIPYAYLIRPELSCDFWVIRVTE